MPHTDFYTLSPRYVKRLRLRRACVGSARLYRCRSRGVGVSGHIDIRKNQDPIVWNMVWNFFPIYLNLSTVHGVSQGLRRARRPR